MHRRYVAFLMLIALVAFALPAQGAILNYEAYLNGLQETPPNPSPAAGYATITIDTALNTLSYTITYSPLVGTETAAHIHGFAAAGVAAGVMHALPPGTPKIGTWNYAEPDEASILAGLTYINIHSTLYTGGEIRGQILAVPPTPIEPSTWGQIKDLYRSAK